ncbi:MAG: penicillin-binding protein activator [Legionellales bacterium]|nr:penicillin-binding protein activator [Legionellales bacterium]
MLNSCTKNTTITPIPEPVLNTIPNNNNGSLNKLMDYANRSPDEQQQFDYILKAAGLLIDQGNASPAKQLLTNMPTNMPSELNNRKYLLLSKISLLNHQTKRALQDLAKIDIYSLNKQELIFYFRMASRAYTQKSDWYNSAISLIKINKLFSGDAQQYNTKRVFYLLAKMKKHELHSATIENTDIENKKWLQISNIYRRYPNNPELLAEKLQEWQHDNQDHHLYNLFNHSFTSDFRKKQIHIALFLPLSGNFSKAGKTIREGFMTALFNYQGNKKYHVNVYDTTSNLSINELHQKALDNKVSFIIGPLIRNNISQLYDINKTIETIVLNNPGDNSNYSSHIYQFSLDLPQEAELVAYKAFHDNHRNTFIIWQGNEWGERIKDAFSKTWEKLGGIIVDDITISKEYPINKNLIEKLGLSASHNRKNQLQLGLPKIKFYPKTRQDIDMIFLATNSSSARQVVPLLKYNYANEIPIYGTSSIYKGSPKIIRDKDLNEVIFCDMPNILNLPINKNYIEWPDQLNSKERLFNLGYDAFMLMTNINTLKNANLVGINLKSGHAYLNENNKIIRELDWAKFRNGKPILYNG